MTSSCLFCTDFVLRRVACLLPDAQVALAEARQGRTSDAEARLYGAGIERLLDIRTLVDHHPGM